MRQDEIGDVREHACLVRKSLDEGARMVMFGRRAMLIGYHLAHRGTLDLQYLLDLSDLAGEEPAKPL
jgi:hypothetical protein